MTVFTERIHKTKNDPYLENKGPDIFQTFKIARYSSDLSLVKRKPLTRTQNQKLQTIL